MTGTVKETKTPRWKQAALGLTILATGMVAGGCVVLPRDDYSYNPQSQLMPWGSDGVPCCASPYYYNRRWWSGVYAPSIRVDVYQSGGGFRSNGPHWRSYGGHHHRR